MPITPLPSPGPDINDKVTFPARASSQAAALPKLVDDINSAMLAFGPGRPFIAPANVTGTANAITLTSGLNLAALVDGQAVRFRATAANTGATTINLDGRGAKAALTIGGAALNAGYIQAGTGSDALETVAIYRAASDSFIVQPPRNRLGYWPGQVGVVTQPTSKSTTVTNNGIAGTITTEGGALAADAGAVFTVNNSTVEASDLVLVTATSNHGGNYNVFAYNVLAGSFQVVVFNEANTTQTHAIVLSFMVFKKAAS